jgi:hypothetical protein
MAADAQRQLVEVIALIPLLACQGYHFYQPWHRYKADAPVILVRIITLLLVVRRSLRPLASTWQ